MTLAADTREAVREHPFLYDALRAGVVNYAAAARFLGVGDDADTEAVVAALRRYAEELPDHDDDSDRGEVPVSMRSSLGRGDPGDALVVVGETALVPGEGSLTGVVATGEVDAAALRAVLGRLETAGIGVEAAGVADGALVVTVGRRDGPDAVRVVEAVLGT